MSNLPAVDLCLFGAHGVGTTSVLAEATNRPFDREHEPTIGVDIAIRPFELPPSSTSFPYGMRAVAASPACDTTIKTVKTKPPSAVNLETLESCSPRTDDALQCRYDVALQRSADHLGVEGNAVVKARCWEVAGNERFRTIVVSYIDRSDALCFVYDVTDASTFEPAFDDYLTAMSRARRGRPPLSKTWLLDAGETSHCLRQSSGDLLVPVILFGNKVDLLSDEAPAVRAAFPPNDEEREKQSAQLSSRGEVLPLFRTTTGDKREDRGQGQRREVFPEMVAALCEKHGIDPSFAFEGSAKTGAGVARAIAVAARLATAQQRRCRGIAPTAPTTSLRGGIRLPNVPHTNGTDSD